MCVSLGSSMCVCVIRVCLCVSSGGVCVSHQGVCLCVFFKRVCVLRMILKWNVDDIGNALRCACCVCTWGMQLPCRTSLVGK